MTKAKPQRRHHGRGDRTVIRRRAALRTLLAITSAIAATGVAIAATPIAGRSYYSATLNTTATVTNSGRAMDVFFQPGCSSSRFSTIVGFRFAKKVRIRNGGRFVYVGSIMSVSGTRGGGARTINGTAKMAGRFFSRQKMRATLRFSVAGCQGRRRMTATLLSAAY
jgi:hypothetical protein